MRAQVVCRSRKKRLVKEVDFIRNDAQAGQGGESQRPRRDPGQPLMQGDPRDNEATGRAQGVVKALRTKMREKKNTSTRGRDGNRRVSPGLPAAEQGPASRPRKKEGNPQPEG